jgi:lipopolysaccharide transport system permease protein
MLDELKNLYAYRDLLWMWTIREIKVRYKQSVLGAAWAILQPLSLTAMFSVVFSHFARIPSEGVPYPIFAYAALMPWTLFATSVSFAVPILVSNVQLVTKIYFPREILPLAAIGAAIVDFLVSLLVFAGLLLAYGVPLTGALAWIPVLLAIQVALMIGISLAAAGVNVFYRDIRFVVPLVMQLWMYASPIIYPVSLVPESLRPLYMLNPMAGLVSSYRQVTLQGIAPAPGDLLPALAASLLACGLGYCYFKRVEPDFADTI